MARILNIFSKIFLLFAVQIATQGCDFIGNSLTDSEAKGIAISLSKKLNIEHTDNLVVKSPPLLLVLFAGAEVKNAKLVTSPDNHQTLAIVNCKNKEVTNITNPDAMERVLNKLGP